MNEKRKTIFQFLPILFLLAVLVYMFIDSINKYQKYDITYSDTQCEQLTFQKYEEERHRKGGFVYEIYFEEYAEPFHISNITRKELDVDALESLNANSAVKVYYWESTSHLYEYSICEMQYGTTTLLSLSDYVEANRDYQKEVMIIFPILMVLLLLLMGLMVWMKKAEKDQSLGKLKIEHIQNGNVIQVYNSPNICSLLINGKVVDKYKGLVGGPFYLQGELEIGEEKILIEAKMGFVNMRLYCNGVLVGKKFMVFG